MTSQLCLSRKKRINKFLKNTQCLTSSIVFIGALFLSCNSNAFYQQSEQQAQPDQQTSPTSSDVKIKWPTDLQLLEEQNHADDSYWLQLEEEKTLVLKYFAKGKRLRGNVLLLHTQGENPQHIRLIDPLSRQLSRLGWQVWIPTLPLSDFPITKPTIQNSNDDSQANPTGSSTNENNSSQAPAESTPSDPNANPATDTSSTQQSDQESVKGYFETIESYQAFFTQLISQIIGNAAGSQGQFAIVTNQTSAYWILPTVASDQRVNQLIMIAPQLPEGVKTDLEPLFQTQNTPVYTFIDDESNSVEFVKAFQKQLWRSPFQRLNRGMIDNLKYNNEDVTVAKSITGWIDSQLRTKK